MTLSPVQQVPLCIEQPNAAESVHAMIATMHQTIAELAARYHALPHPTEIDYETGPIYSPTRIYDLLRAELEPLAQEQVIVLSLDQQHRVIDRRTVYQGLVNGCNVRVAELLRPPIVFHAPAMIVAHNHPSGDTTPSNQDRTMTRDLKAAAELMGIDLLDHVIIGRQPMSVDGFTSMARLGLVG